jgi:hypothetical protein
LPGAIQGYRQVVASKTVSELRRLFSAAAIDVCEGHQDGARAKLSQMIKRCQQRGENPIEIATLCAMLKDKEQTLKWAAQLYADLSYDTPFLNVFHDFDFLRGDPRFEALMKKAGFRD